MATINISKHFLQPFYDNQNHIPLSPTQKWISGIIGAVCCCSPFLFISGYAAFFGMTYYFKNRNIKKMAPSSKLHSIQSKSFNKLEGSKNRNASNSPISTEHSASSRSSISSSSSSASSKKTEFEGYPIAIVEAIGGEAAFSSLPVVVNEDGVFDVEDMTAPIMKGSFGNYKYLLFSYIMEDATGKNKEYLEFLSWKENEQCWWSPRSYKRELAFCFSNEKIQKGSAEEHYMLNRIKRLVDGEPIGKLERYTSNGVDLLYKPNDKDLYRPSDAYLKGAELEAFMDFPCMFYERECPFGSFDIILKQFH